MTLLENPLNVDCANIESALNMSKRWGFLLSTKFVRHSNINQSTWIPIATRTVTDIWDDNFVQLSAARLSPASKSLIELFAAIRTANRNDDIDISPRSISSSTSHLDPTNEFRRTKKGTFAHISHVNKHRHTTDTAMKICGQESSEINSTPSLRWCWTPENLQIQLLLRNFCVSVSMFHNFPS